MAGADPKFVGTGIQRDRRVINFLQLQTEFLGWLRVTLYSYKIIARKSAVLY